MSAPRIRAALILCAWLTGCGLDFDAAFSDSASAADASLESSAGGSGGLPDASHDGADVGSKAGAGGTSAGGAAGSGGSNVGGSQDAGPEAGGSEAGGSAGSAGSEAGVPPTCAIKSLQGGMTTLEAGLTTKQVPLVAVELQHSLVMFSLAFGTGDPDVTQLSGQLSSPTQLLFERNGTDDAVGLNIRWYVAEFDACVTVQRGTVSMNGSMTTVSLMEAADLAHSVPLISASMGGQLYNNSDMLRAKLEDPVTLRVHGAPTQPNQIAWQVVTFDAAAVQTGDVTMPQGMGTQTAPLAAVDPASTWLLYSYEGAATSPAASSMMVTGKLAGSEQLAFSRLQNQGALLLTWYAVSFQNGTKVHTGSSTVAGLNQSIPLPGVALDHSIASAGALYYRGGATPYAGTNLGVSSVMLDLGQSTTGTKLDIIRGTSLSQAQVDWSVVQFP